MSQVYGILKFLMLSIVVSTTIYVYSMDTTTSAIITSLAWQPDNQRLAVATTNGIYVHDARTLNVLQQLNEDEPVSSLDWSPDGQQIAFDTPDNQVRVINLSHNTAKELTKQRFDISDVRWSPNGLFVASKSNYEIYVWDIETNKVVVSMEGYFHTPVIAWHPDSQLLATHQDEHLTVWNIHTGAKVAYWYDDIEARVIAWSPDGQYLIVSGLSGVLRIFSLGREQPVKLLKVDDYGVEWLSWRPNTEIVATRGWVNSNKTTKSIIKIWDVMKGELLSEIPAGYIAGGLNYRSFEWSPDGSLLGVASDDGMISIYDAETLVLKVNYPDYLPVPSVSN